MTHRGTALVTGGGRGIGAAIAVALAGAGFDIAIATVERETEAEDVVQRVRARGRSALYVQLDISRVEQHRGLIDRIEAELGAIDCLVNNAGVTSLVRGDMLDVSTESFDRSFAINVRGTFFLTQAVARRMLDKGPGGTDAYRSIVTITSANADIVGANRADYCMTKAALSMMSRLYATRLAAANVHVFEVRPGIIRTEMTRPATEKYDAFIAGGGVPLGRWGTAAEVGSAVATLATGGLPFATGEVVNVGGGLQLHRL